MDSSIFGSEKISRILLKTAPPVMLAGLIQALYNIADSFFIGKVSQSGLTALSIVYPFQLLMIALAVGTGVGTGTAMSAKFGLGKDKEANEFAGVCMPLELVLWVIFALISFFAMPFYAKISTNSQDVIEDVISYGRIVCVFSISIFLESGFTKILQARGDMKTPMIGQIIGAAINIVLDPVMIFGLVGFPPLGVKGAAIATVLGQTGALFTVMKKAYVKAPEINKFPMLIKTIFKLGIPNMLMQAAYTVYIFGLNMILSKFSDAAVTTLGLYYKWQTIFIIPLSAMQTCIVPIVSYNYASGQIDRCKKTLIDSLLFGMGLMSIGILCFEIIPKQMLSVFSSDEQVLNIGTTAFRIIGISFIPIVSSLVFPVFFQALGFSFKSSLLTIIRTVVLFVPLGYFFSKFGLDYFWLTFPVTDIITSVVGFIFYRQFCKLKSNVKVS